MTAFTRTHHGARAPYPAKRQNAFSLVEMMVAMTIGLILMAGLLQLLVNSSRTHDEVSKTNALADNGRIALQLLQDEIAHAGFWDGHIPQFDDRTIATAPSDIPAAAPNPCLAYTSWNNAYRDALIGIPVQVFGYASPAAVCASVIQQPVVNTDFLVVRYANTCVAGTGTCGNTAGRLYFQASRCQSDTSNYVLGTNNFNMRQRNCITGAERRQFISYIYYIRSYSTTVGDGIPTLVRAQLDNDGGTIQFGAATPIVENIEAMRVELGIDNLSDNGTNILTDPVPTNRYDAALRWVNPATESSPLNRGNGTPDTYVLCGSAGCSVGQLNNVVTAKLHILARSPETTRGYTDTKRYNLGSAVTLGPFNDSFKRHVFSTTVRLNNVSARRETRP